MALQQFRRFPSYPSLPQELIDNVVDYLHPCKRDLCSVSLVSRKWHSRAKHHLYYRIRIICLDQNYTIAQFISHLDLAPDIGPYIRELHIGRYLDSPTSTLADVSIDYTLVDAILQRLPSLQSLLLDGLQLYASKHVDKESQFPKRTLKRLSLQKLYNSADQLFLILGLFKKIDTLSISQCGFGWFESTGFTGAAFRESKDIPSWTTSLNPADLQVGSLIVSNGSYHISELLANNIRYIGTAITSLDINFPTRLVSGLIQEDINVLMQLLDHVQDTLEHFAVDITQKTIRKSPALQTLLEPLELFRCHRLSSLRIRLYHSTLALCPDIPYQWSAIPVLLSQLLPPPSDIPRSPSLTHLYLELRFSNMVSSDALLYTAKEHVDWEAISQALEPFETSLLTLSFECISRDRARFNPSWKRGSVPDGKPSLGEEWVELLREKFHEWYARRILHIK